MLARFSTSCLRNVATTKPVWQRPMVSSPHMVTRYFQTKKPINTTLFNKNWATQPKRVFTTTTRLLSKVPPAIEKKIPVINPAELKERNATDWAIIKQLMKYIWPKNDIGVKTRVVIALSLLLGGKVSKKGFLDGCKKKN